MDTHVMRMVKSWWNTWGDERQADPAALVELADGIHRLIREAEADTRRQYTGDEDYAGPHRTSVVNAPLFDQQ